MIRRSPLHNRISRPLSRQLKLLNSNDFARQAIAIGAGERQTSLARMRAVRARNHLALRWSRLNEDCSPRPAQINIISTAAMHTPLPRWVKTRIYRIATLTAGSPQLADIPRQALDLDQVRDVSGLVGPSCRHLPGGVGLRQPTVTAARMCAER
jgi:hypothetical protein